MFFQFRNNTERRCRVCGSPEGVLSPSFRRGRICRKCMNAAQKVKSSERRSRQPKKETFLCRECGKTTRSPSRLCFRCQGKPKKKTGERRPDGACEKIQPGTPVFPRVPHEFSDSLPADAQRLPAIRPVCRETVKKKAPGPAGFGGCFVFIPRGCSHLFEFLNFPPLRRPSRRTNHSSSPE